MAAAVNKQPCDSPEIREEGSGGEQSTPCDSPEKREEGSGGEQPPPAIRRRTGKKAAAGNKHSHGKKGRRARGQVSTSTGNAGSPTDGEGPDSDDDLAALASPLLYRASPSLARNETEQIRGVEKKKEPDTRARHTRPNTRTEGEKKADRTHES